MPALKRLQEVVVRGLGRLRDGVGITILPNAAASAPGGAQAGGSGL